MAASVYSVIVRSLYSSCFKNYSLLKSVEILIMPELVPFLHVWVSGNLWCKNNFQEVSFRNIFFQKTWNIIYHFLNCYLVAPWPTLDHSQGSSLTNSLLITAFLTISTRSSQTALWRGWVPKPGWASSGLWTGSLPILTTMPQPTRRLSSLHMTFLFSQCAANC